MAGIISIDQCGQKMFPPKTLSRMEEEDMFSGGDSSALYTLLIYRNHVSPQQNELGLHHEKPTVRNPQYEADGNNQSTDCATTREEKLKYSHSGQSSRRSGPNLKVQNVCTF